MLSICARRVHMFAVIRNLSQKIYYFAMKVTVYLYAVGN